MNIEGLLLLGTITFILLALRVPVAFSLLAAGIGSLLWMQGPTVAASVLSRNPFQTVSSYSLIVVPMFIAMGVLAMRSGLANDGFTLAARLTKRIPGGLAIATVFSCAMFAAVSGSSVATVVAMGPVAIQEMRRHGYDLRIAAGVVGAAGTLGVLIPPSIVLVIYGILTGESIGKLLLAGIIPGFLTAAVYALALYLRALKNPQEMGGSQLNDQLKQFRKGIKVSNLIKLGMLFLVVMGSIYAGIATPIEASAMGALLALLFYLWDLMMTKRAGRGKELWGALSESVRLIGMTMALLVGGAVFTYALVVARVPSEFAKWVTGLELPRVAILVAILLAFIVMGMFLDGLSILLIAVPLTYPVVTALGYDGIWFAILVVKAIEIGLISPPFGLNAFVVAGITPGLTVEKAFRGVSWFIPLEMAIMALIIVFPDIVTFLPDLSSAKG